MKRMAWVTYQFEAWHAWPDAPKNRDYLASRHRHLFHVRLDLELEHDNRDIEFHDLRDEVGGVCDGLVAANRGDLKAMSCEMVAMFVGEAIRAKHQGRDMVCSVSEDGENGATLTWGKEDVWAAR